MTNVSIIPAVSLLSSRALRYESNAIQLCLVQWREASKVSAIISFVRSSKTEFFCFAVCNVNYAAVTYRSF